MAQSREQEKKEIGEKFNSYTISCTECRIGKRKTERQRCYPRYTHYMTFKIL